jgi:hypothetical protein
MSQSYSNTSGNSNMNFQTDPYQLNNLLSLSNNTMYPSSGTILPDFNESLVSGYQLPQIVFRLDALLMVLKRCAGKSCIEPWDVIHPGGNIRTLKQALNPKYDAFYEKNHQNNAVSFGRCEDGQILDAEGSQEAMIYRDARLSWSDWT